MGIYGAYLEDYHYIKVIIPNNIEYKNLLLRRLDQFEGSNLQIDRIEKIGNDLHLHCSFKIKILIHYDYEVIINKDLIFLLSLGKITKTKRFELENYFNDWLGYKYTKQYTTFRIWSPVSKEMYLVLNDNKYRMNYFSKGVWEITIDGDLDLSRYFYLFRINEEFETSLDPYGITTNEFKTCNYVINLESLYQQKYEYVKIPREDSIIYEIHIRDFTSTLDVKHPGTFMGLIESESLKDKGINYLKELGITHVQLMPIFEFGGVNDKVKSKIDPNFKYNWGYNPEQFFIPSGWYATTLEDPKARINEFKMMIDCLHKNQIGVNMDVVYNHVYDHTTFSIGKLVPGYVYRTDKRGFLTNSSGCGNDIKSEKMMISKFIIDNVLFFQNFYRIDGFRFDLMGLLNVDLINKIYEEVVANNKFVNVYGEGWNMNAYLPSDQAANMENYWQMPNIGFFNDQFRDFCQKRHYDLPNYINEVPYDYQKLIFLLNGSEDNDLMFLSSMQSINYIESHDDMSFYDTISHFERTKIIDKVKLVLGTLLVSKGISFIHSGMELLRSKKGNRNPYNLGDDYNHFPWENLEENQELVKYVKMFISLRKQTNHLKPTYEFDEKTNILKVSWDNYILDAYIKNDYKELYIKDEKLDRPGIYLIGK